jgi:hypothetical protein
MRAAWKRVRIGLVPGEAHGAAEVDEETSSANQPMEMPIRFGQRQKRQVGRTFPATPRSVL